MLSNLITVNTILYCRQWPAMVNFYRDQLRLPVNFATDWFIEFYLTANSRLSIADENRASIKSASGKGITITVEVEEIEPIHKKLQDAGLVLTRVWQHPWNAKVFHLFDPEGNRLEVWQSTQDDRLS